MQLKYYKLEPIFISPYAVHHAFPETNNHTIETTLHNSGEITVHVLLLEPQLANNDVKFPSRSLTLQRSIVKSIDGVRFQI